MGKRVKRDRPHFLYAGRINEELAAASQVIDLKCVWLMAYQLPFHALESQAKREE